MKKVILLLLFTAVAYSTYASHLLGGIMTYRYMGRTGPGQSQAVFEITLKIYRDCLNGQADYDDPLTLGVYNASQQLEQSIDFTLLQRVNVSPVQVSNCPKNPNVCIEEGTYRKSIIVSANQAYHLLYQRCCRNIQNNLTDDMGQSYYCYIPAATQYPDNSPVILGVPAPYVCAGDTVTYSNAASDADGDSLVYSIEQPWTGGNRVDPKPTPAGSISLPLPVANYKFGYSNAVPFGNGGILNINPQTGLTTLLAPSVGQYSFAVVVKSYRKVNGVWVYVTEIRRDLQLIVITCGQNIKPMLVSGGGGSTNYTVEAGDSICFDINYYDPDYTTYTYQTKLNLVGIGDILKGTNGYTGPRAKLTQLSSQYSNILYRFCWNTTCVPVSQVRGFPYSINITVNDSGCPPKFTSTDFYITVIPYTANASITGETKPCEKKVYTYTASSKKGVKYNWVISGPGTIVSGQGTKTITVIWNSPGTGSLTVNDTTANGCIGDPFTLPVTIFPAPVINYKITGDSVLCEKVIAIYSVPFKPNTSFNWRITGGNQINGGTTNSIGVQWGLAGAGLIELVEMSQSGCGSDTLKFPVRIANAKIDTINGPRSVCPNITMVEYKTNFIAGAKYTWIITGGVQSGGGNSNVITINWGDVGTGTIKVVAESKEGCLSDTMYATVIKNHTIQGFTPIGDTVVCEFTQNKTYEVVYTNRSLYSWIVSGGTIQVPTNGPKITVNWGAAGIGKVTCIETSFDSINNLPCNGLPATLLVRISPIPNASSIKGDTFLCQTNNATSYTLNGYPGSRYIWWLDNDSANITGQGKNTVQFIWNKPGNFTIRVLEISRDSCIGNPVSLVVHVNPKPVTTAISGDSVICYPNIVNRTYTVKGYATSTYLWYATNGNQVGGNNSNTATFSFFDVPDVYIKVVEVSEFGCVGDTQYLHIFIDHPSVVIKSVGDLYTNDKDIILQWKILNAPRYNSNVEIWRRNAFTADNFTYVDTARRTDSVYIHKSQNTSASAYEYEVKIHDLCGNPITAPYHRNILLGGHKVNDDNYSVTLQWNRYFGWNTGVKRYELYRKLGDNGAWELYDMFTDDTSATYKNGFDSYYQCYRIKAIENNGGFEQESWSNEICFGFDPIVWIPNAFSPDGNGLNDFYEIFTASIKEFHLSIYNRWGTLLFETYDPKVYWDGTFMGKNCQVDAYIYMVEYKGFDNKRIIKNGTVTLLR